MFEFVTLPSHKHTIINHPSDPKGVLTCRTWSLRMCPAPGCKTKMNTMNSVVCGECRSKVAHLDMGFPTWDFSMGLADWLIENDIKIYRVREGTGSGVA